MSNPIPNALALTSIPDGAAIVAADHRNNYLAIQAAVNALATALKGGAAGQLLQAADSTDVQWVNVGGIYRKQTAKQVVSSVAETDLLNGEITIAAGLIGVSGIARFSAWGDLINNTGGAQVPPRFKLKLGGTAILDTGAPAANMSGSASRFGWRIDATIQNLGAANAQWATLLLKASMTNGVGNNAVAFATGEGITSLISVAGGFGIMDANGGAAAAIDTSVAKLLELTVINGVSNALYDTTLKGALVEVL